MDARPAPLRLLDPGGGTVLTWDQRAYVELLVGIVVHYAGRTEDEARALVTGHRASAPPTDYDDASLITHDTPYQWAMHIAHGQGYWQRGIPSDEPPGYDEWEHDFLAARGLSFPYEFRDADAAPSGTGTTPPDV